MGGEGPRRSMEATGGSIEYPTVEDIIDLNRTLIEVSGSGLQSPDLIRDRGTIDWAINDVQGLGYDPCDTLIDKATLLAWRIVARHPFKDGNKRTGMGVALAFLRTNGLGYVVTDGEIERIAKLCADCANTGYTEAKLKAWFTRITNIDWQAYWEAIQEERMERDETDDYDEA